MVQEHNFGGSGDSHLMDSESMNAAAAAGTGMFEGSSVKSTRSTSKRGASDGDTAKLLTFMEEAAESKMFVMGQGMQLQGLQFMHSGLKDDIARKEQREDKLLELELTYCDDPESAKAKLITKRMIPLAAEICELKRKLGDLHTQITELVKKMSEVRDKNK